MQFAVIAASKTLGTLVAVTVPDYGSLLVLFSFEKYLLPNRTSFCSQVLVLVAVVFFVCGAAIATGELRFRPPF